MDYEKTSYQLLEPCPHCRLDEDSVGAHPSLVKWKRLPKQAYFYIVLVVALVISNGILLWGEMHRNRCSSTIPYWGTDRTIIRPFHWVTDFSGENKTESSPHWKDLFPDGEGIVAVPDDWAAFRQLPVSIKSNKTSTESLYYVAAYHQLHCLTVIRALIYHLKEGVAVNTLFPHAIHCLDSLRQGVMCAADDTLLYTEDAKVYGDGQSRICRDWDALAQWTNEHRIQAVERR